MVERRRLKLVETPAPGAALTAAPLVTPDIAKIGGALSAMPCSPYIGADDWAKTINAIWFASSGSDDGLNVAIEWSKPNVLFHTADDVRTRWINCAKFPPNDMDVDTLFKMAAAVREREQARERAEVERDRQLDEVARLDDADYEESRAAFAKKRGWRVGELDKERARRRKKDGASKAPSAPPAPTIDELAKAAKDIIADDDVLNLFAKSIAQTLAGESYAGQILYLCATSRLFPRPMNVTVKGLSAIGKSHLRDQVLAYIPAEDIVSFTTWTEKALIYLPDNMAHKILSMGEATGSRDNELQDYLLREIISDGRITHMVPVPGPPGELPSTRRVVKEGPIMFVTTTTRARLHPEIETRILSIETDDTEKQTARVLDKIAEIEGGLIEPTIDLAPWLAFQRWLATGERRVVIPFAKELARRSDVKEVRMRRDFRQVLTAIKAHALLHRARRQRDAQGRIVAAIDQDYSIVFELLAERLAQGAGTKLTKNDLRVLNEIQALQPRDGTGVKAASLIRKLDLSQATVNRRLIKLAAIGYVENLAPGKGRTGQYSTSGRPAGYDVLPGPEELDEEEEEGEHGEMPD